MTLVRYYFSFIFCSTVIYYYSSLKRILLGYETRALHRTLLHALVSLSCVLSILCLLPLGATYYIPVVIMSPLCSCTLPIIFAGHMCAPVLFRSYFWPLWVSCILLVVLVALLCALYCSGHTCYYFNCIVLLRLYFWSLRVSCNLPFVPMGPFCVLYSFICTCGPSVCLVSILPCLWPLPCTQYSSF